LIAGTGESVNDIPREVCALTPAVSTLISSVANAISFNIFSVLFPLVGSIADKTHWMNPIWSPFVYREFFSIRLAAPATTHFRKFA